MKVLYREGPAFLPRERETLRWSRMEAAPESWAKQAPSVLGLTQPSPPLLHYPLCRHPHPTPTALPAAPGSVWEQCLGHAWLVSPYSPGLGLLLLGAFPDVLPQQSHSVLHAQKLCHVYEKERTYGSFSGGREGWEGTREQLVGEARRTQHRLLKNWWKPCLPCIRRPGLQPHYLPPHLHL